MGRVNHYLLRHFSSLFASMFFTLFFITSVVFFIKIASITSVIKISFYELGVLYAYLIPSILLYTLPITFFIALCISLFNLSKDNEIIVLFTLGYTPKKIAKLFLKIASILSLMLIIDILILIPIAKQLNINFIEYKKAEAKLNIKATEFGQKFSDWLVYIDKSDKKNSYNGVVMYQEATAKQTEKIIIAKKANILNYNGIFKLNLDDGKAFEISPTKIEQINFKKMSIKSKPKQSISGVQDIITYWKLALQNDKRAYELSLFLVIALFPLATVLLGVSIGIVTYRYERGSINPTIATVIFGYVGLGVPLARYGHLWAVLFMFVFTTLLSLIYYRKKIHLRY